MKKWLADNWWFLPRSVYFAEQNIIIGYFANTHFECFDAGDMSLDSPAEWRISGGQRSAALQ